PHVEGARRGTEAGLARDREVAARPHEDPPVVLARPARGRARDGSRSLAAVASSAFAAGGAPVVRRADDEGGVRPALPEPRGALRGDRGGARLSAIRRLAPHAARVGGGRGGGRGDPGGAPGPAGQGAVPGGRRAGPERRVG